MNDAMKRIKRRISGVNKGRHVMPLPCPICGKTAVATFTMRSDDPADYDVSINANCQHDQEVRQVACMKQDEIVTVYKQYLDGDMPDLDPADGNACPYCGYNAPTLAGVVSHINNVHGDRLITCPYCGVECASFRGLIHHIRLKHEGKQYDKFNIIMATLADIWGVPIALLAD